MLQAMLAAPRIVMFIVFLLRGVCSPDARCGKPVAIVPQVTHAHTTFLPLKRKTGNLQASVIFFNRGAKWYRPVVEEGLGRAPACSVSSSNGVAASVPIMTPPFPRTMNLLPAMSW